MPTQVLMPNQHEAWIQFLLEHPERGGNIERLIFEAGWKAGVESAEEDYDSPPLYWPE